MATEQVRLDGHIVDTLTLAKVLDLIVEAGADYTITDFVIGRTASDPSSATLDIVGDDETVERLLGEIQAQGANRVDPGDGVLVECERDGVLPAGFYSTTNLATEVRVGGRWLPVERPEMDCAIVAFGGRAVCTPMHRVRRGDRVVVGRDGVRVHTPSATRNRSFAFMTSDVSPERAKDLQVRKVADAMCGAHDAGHDGRILAVAGPAVVHTGGAAGLARLVREGWVDVLFAGNGFATHDIERAVLGTSLGIQVVDGTPAEGGHANHIRVINEVRGFGSIAGAVEAGYVASGVMYECVKRGIPFVLAGSIRDDGPLPDVITDTVAAVDAMRSHIEGVTVTLLLASTLHAIATGNILPASVQTFCVDINPAVVTKLADRGSHQGVGIVTDVGSFVNRLADELAGR